MDKNSFEKNAATRNPSVVSELRVSASVAGIMKSASQHKLEYTYPLKLEWLSMLWG